MTDLSTSNLPADTSKAPDNPQRKFFLTLAIGGTAAILLLIFEVLPAKYGIDLTGFGTYVGLTKIYEQNTELLAQQTTEQRNEKISIDVPSGEDLEYKLFLLKGDRIEYSWTTDEQDLFFDFHGEPRGGSSGHFQSYAMGTSQQNRGTLEANFAGTHGWYWRNDHPTPITITLDVQGKFNLIGKKAAAFRR